jgi:hypothetical protein
MLKKIWQSIKDFLKPPRLQDPQPALYGEFSIVKESIIKHVEMRNIELANLRLQKESFEKNLIIHRTMIITLVAVIVSILASAGALIISTQSKDNVTVKVYEVRK